MNELLENVHYKLEVDKETSDVYIRIIDGEYEGTSYLYGNVAFDESQDNDQVYLNFNYEIIESDLDKKILEDDIDFKNHIGDILVAIINKNLEENKAIHELGTANIE